MENDSEGKVSGKPQPQVYYSIVHRVPAPPHKDIIFWSCLHKEMADNDNKKSEDYIMIIGKYSRREAASRD